MATISDHTERRFSEHGECSPPNSGLLWLLDRFLNVRAAIPQCGMRRALSRPIVVGAVLAISLVPAITVAEIVWNGDFSTGNFIQYHSHTSDKEVFFWSVPPYGRPTAPTNLPDGYRYGHTGNGDLLSIVNSPTRGGPYAAKFVVKSLANTVEPDDCDPGGDDCSRRRGNLWMQRTHGRWYPDALPHMGERWVSWSVYLDQDWPDTTGSFFNLASIKMESDAYSPQGYFVISMANNNWEITHTWHPDTTRGSNPPWQYRMFYAGSYEGKPYPRSDNWPDGLADFPDEQASVAALQSVRKGGWTDWILHFKQDHRGSRDDGTGFMTLWKREDSGPWVKVLHILPKQTTRGGITFDHGIGFNLSATPYPSAGTNTGPYLSKKHLHPTQDFIYFVGNHKIGDEQTTFAEMSHDGSTPDSEAGSLDVPPKAPEVQPVE